VGAQVSGAIRPQHLANHGMKGCGNGKYHKGFPHVSMGAPMGSTDQPCDVADSHYEASVQQNACQIKVVKPNQRSVDPALVNIVHTMFLKQFVQWTFQFDNV